jgi:4-methyl-5(b-hydroxyethyl)-thiazole monophosphate biosynthesis
LFGPNFYDVGGIVMVYVHLAEGFEEIEALTVVDVLRRADIDVKTVSITGNEIVRGAHDISVSADILFDKADYKSCQMIVLPGGMPGTANLAKHEGLAAQLTNFAEEGKWLSAICAAPSVLGGLSLPSQGPAAQEPPSSGSDSGFDSKSCWLQA